MTTTDERRAAETERERRGRIKRHVQANAWHHNPDDGREARLIVHSLAGGFGADWDLLGVLDRIDRAVEVKFNQDVLTVGHLLEVVADELLGDDGRTTRRTVWFDVPPMHEPDPVPDSTAHLRPSAGDRVLIELEGTVVEDAERTVVMDETPRRTGSVISLARPLALADRRLRSARVLETATFPAGERACMYHQEHPRPAVGGIAVCADCRDAMVVRRPVRDDPQA